MNFPQPEFLFDDALGVRERLGELVLHGGAVFPNWIIINMDFDPLSSGQIQIHLGDNTFEVLKVLGRGSDAVVWKVRNLETGETYALRGQSVYSNEATRTIEHNVDLASRLGMLGIGPRVHFAHVTICANVSAQDPHLLLMLMQTGKNIPPGISATALLNQVEELLARLFAANIYLLDIKPENTIIVDGGSLRLIDFDYRWGTEVAPGKNNRELLPDEKAAAMTMLIMQYALLLAQNMVDSAEFLQYELSARLPSDPVLLAALYQTAVTDSPLPKMTKILHYNPQAFDNVDCFVRQVLSREGRLSGHQGMRSASEAKKKD